MFVEQADAMITHVSGQDTRKSWQKGYKGGPHQRPHMQVKSSGGETSAHGSGNPEPMELGVVRCRTLFCEEYQKYLLKMPVLIVTNQMQDTLQMTTL